MAKILLLEDDKLVGESAVDGLTAAGHTVEWVMDGEEAAERLRLYQYDIAIFDWNVPRRSGIEVCRSYRESGGNAPIIMLTARGADSEKVEGLDSGADDYLTKPFSITELTARIRALLRRPAQTTQNVLRVGDIELNVASTRASRAGKPIDLLAKEFALLEFLMRRPDTVFDVTELLNHVWSSESDSSEQAVRQCISRLRKKLEAEGKSNPLETVKGLGYRLSSLES